MKCAPLLCLALAMVSQPPAPARAQSAYVEYAASLGAPKGVKFLVPHPPYPLWAIKQRLESTAELKIVFNARGDVTQVTVLKSKGTNALSQYGADYVKKHWKCLSGKPEVFQKSVIFRLS